MSITTEKLGPNSWMIACMPGTSINEWLAEATSIAIEAGWTEIDSIYTSETVQRKIFTAPMADNPSILKYIGIEVATPNVWIRVYESWNSETHVGLNQPYTRTPASQFAYADVILNGGITYIFANQRYFFFSTKNFAGTYTVAPFAGCIEISKDNPEEVTGEYPRYILLEGHGLGGSNATTTYTSVAALPRRPFSNGTGNGSSDTLSVGSLIWRPQFASINLYTSPTQQSGMHIIRNLNPWNNKLYAWDMYLFDMTYTTAHIRGRLMGLKQTSAVNIQPMNKLTNIPVDENFLYDPNGTPTDFWILHSENTASNNRVLLPV